jgi:tight adherence protein C
MPLLLFLGLALLAGAAYFACEVATLPSRERHQSVRRAATYGRFRRVAGTERVRFRERVVAPASESLASFVLRLNPRVTVETVRARLLAAGLADRLTPTAFLAAKGALAGGGLLFGALVGFPANPGSGLLLTLGGALVGFFLPDLLLAMRARARREQVRAELPDALDLLAVSVEAGLGFDGAIAKLNEHMDGALTEEFGLALGEMRIGEGRQEALKKMAERCDTPEVSTFTRAIIQADQLGISLGRILRVQAADTRLRRQAAAEEKAMKAPIKMLFPLVLFIFPAMFLVILGPALMNLGKLF